ncbi:uncharacterized protein LOC135502294 [Lineus longissimus]|uniref:uncharacterized protein LOC135502294 n=1 Tax=Lineus longissimus TaxID=88925 RepID=UPI00315C9B2F
MASPEPDDHPPIEHLCSICLNEFVEPKITPCGHTFCKECLQKYVDNLTAEDGTPLELECPFCKQPLAIPDGVDSLATNRSTVDIINAHKRSDESRRNLETHKCDICEGPISTLASLACDAQECAGDGLRFCEPCAREHVSEYNCGHNICGLCKSHGKPMRHFCTAIGCNEPICHNCRGVEHSGHDVQLYCDVIATEVENLESDLKAGRQKITQLDAQSLSLCSKERDSTSSVEELNSNLKKGIDLAIKRNKQVIRDDEAEIQLRDRRIREYTDQNKRLNVIKGSLPRRIEGELSNKMAAIESSLSEMEFVKEQITNLLRRGKELITERVLQKSSLRDDMRLTSKHLRDKIKTAERDWVTPHLKSKNFDVEGVNELLQDLVDDVNLQRERITAMACAGLEYYSTDHNAIPAETYEFGCLEIPNSDCECDDDKTKTCLVEVKSVVLMSKCRLAVCCVTGAAGVRKNMKKKQNVWLWDNYTTTATRPKLLISDDAMVEYEYMTKGGENELVLLRRKNPVITILNADVKTKVRRLHVELPEHAIRELWQVDVDSDGHFLLSYFTSGNHTLALVDNSGDSLKVVCNFGVQNCDQISFSRLTREVVTCSFYDDMISVYGIDGKDINKRLSKNASSPHGVGQLVCTDICVGSLGDIFVVGRIKGDPVLKGVYKIILSDDSREVESYEELYQMRSQSDPRCSVHNNRLVVSDGHQLRLLYLR